MAGGSFGTGSGTWTSPRRIEDVLDLDAIRYQTEPAYYRLISNLDMTGFDWIPINGGVNGADPSLPTPCLGIRGYGYTIQNLTISSDTPGGDYDPISGWGRRNFGMFGLTGDFRLDNIKFSNLNIISKRGNRTGGIVGRIDGSCVLTHVHILSGSMIVEKGSVSSQAAYLGGLVGRIDNYGRMTYCSVKNFTITAESGHHMNYVGGLIGDSDGPESETLDGLAHSFAENMVENLTVNAGGGLQYFGGLVGAIWGGDMGYTINKSRAKNVNVTLGAFNGYNEYIGGAFGMVSSGNADVDIYQCYATGSISADAASLADPTAFDAWAVGGFMAVMYAATDQTAVSQCLADVDINLPCAPDDPWGAYIIGGFVASHYDWYKVKDCFAAGDVTAGRWIGGFVGDVDGRTHNDPLFLNCYSRGAVVGVSPDATKPEQNGGVNGFAGGVTLGFYSSATFNPGLRYYHNQIKNCYYDNDICPLPEPPEGHMDSEGYQWGRGISSAQLKAGIAGKPYIPHMSTKQIIVHAHPTESHPITWPANVVWAPGYEPPTEALAPDSEHMLEIEHIMYPDFTERFLGKYFNLTPAVE